MTASSPDPASTNESSGRARLQSARGACARGHPRPGIEFIDLDEGRLKLDHPRVLETRNAMESGQAWQQARNPNLAQPEPKCSRQEIRNPNIEIRNKSEIRNLKTKYCAQGLGG
jgi:hypothetical protein